MVLLRVVFLRMVFLRDGTDEFPFEAATSGLANFRSRPGCDLTQ